MNPKKCTKEKLAFCTGLQEITLAHMDEMHKGTPAILYKTSDVTSCMSGIYLHLCAEEPWTITSLCTKLPYEIRRLT